MAEQSPFSMARCRSPRRFATVVRQLGGVLMLLNTGPAVTVGLPPYGLQRDINVSLGGGGLSVVRRWPGPRSWTRRGRGLPDGFVGPSGPSRPSRPSRRAGTRFGGCCFSAVARLLWALCEAAPVKACGVALGTSRRDSHKLAACFARESFE